MNEKYHTLKGVQGGGYGQYFHDSHDSSDDFPYSVLPGVGNRGGFYWEVNKTRGLHFHVIPNLVSTYLQ